MPQVWVIGHHFPGCGRGKIKAAGPEFGGEGLFEIWLFATAGGLTEHALRKRRGGREGGGR